MRTAATVDGDHTRIAPKDAPVRMVQTKLTPAFYVVDLLWFDGEGVRERPLIERKRLLRSVKTTRRKAGERLQSIPPWMVLTTEILEARAP